MLDGTDEVDDSFLPRDAPDEQNVGLAGVDAVFLQRGGRLDAVVFREVNAVVNDRHALLRHVEVAQDVLSRPFRDGDDGVCHLDGSLFHPAGEIVAAAELLAFPWPQGL